MRILLLPVIIVLFLFFINPVKSQQLTDSSVVLHPHDTINPANFNQEYFEQLLLQKINEAVAQHNKDTFRIKKHLTLAARDQAIYMSKNKKTTIQQVHYEKEFTSVRVTYYGGSMVAREIVDKTVIKKNQEYITYDQACSNLVERLFANKKKAEQLLSKQFYFIGLAARPDVKVRRVYVSLVLGNFKSDKTDPNLKNTLALPYTDKYLGLTAPHPKYCRKIYKTPNVFELQQDLRVEGERIFLNTDNSKTLRKIIRNPDDGIAIDILQKDQFKHNSQNIVDYNKLNRGIIVKPTYSNKFYRKNKADTDNNRYALNVKLGKLPKELTGPYELNLVLIKNKSFCVSIPQTFLIKPKGKYIRTLNYIADIEESSDNFYRPKADSIILDLRIPFEKNKYSFKQKDIEPYINLLNEPDFTIYKLDLKAYSSIEGSEEKNLILQKKREKSILKALQQMQNEPINTTSNSDFNWSDFISDVQNTNYQYLGDLTMIEAQQQIHDKQIYDELEPLLKKHRYADVKMYVHYNIDGDKELPFVLNKFNNAVYNYNATLALNIQKFIIKKVMNNQYHDSVLFNLKLPPISSYTTMKLNQAFIQHRLGKITDSVFFEKLSELNELDPDNGLVNYNQLLYTINHFNIEYLTENYDQLQFKIDNLYKSTLAEELADALNIKYQMKLIANADIGYKQKKQCITTLKKAVNINEESIDNSKKLASIFIENHEYKLAKETLEPWLNNCNDEELLYTYISLCSLNEWDMHTQKFLTAMQMAQLKNKNRFCDLFYSDKFSYRVFENEQIKDLYCKSCLSNKNIAIKK